MEDNVTLMPIKCKWCNREKNKSLEGRSEIPDRMFLINYLSSCVTYEWNRFCHSEGSTPTRILHDFMSWPWMWVIHLEHLLHTWHGEYWVDDHSHCFPLLDWPLPIVDLLMTAHIISWFPARKLDISRCQAIVYCYCSTSKFSFDHRPN